MPRSSGGIFGLLISVYGLLIWGGFAWNFLRELRELTVSWPPVLAFVIGSALSAGIVYAGYNIARDSQFEPWMKRRLLVWGLGGAAVVTGISVLTLLIRRAEGRSVGEPALDVLISLASGMLTGVLIGHAHVRARQHAQQVEQSATKARDRAERARNRRDALTFLHSTLRHELLNGLNVVRGYTAQLRRSIERGDGDRQDRLDSLDVIESQVKNMSTVVQEARALTRTFTGEKELEPTDLSAVLAGRIEAAREAHPEAEIVADVPDRIYVSANETLRHVFENLLRNAIEHNDKSTPEIVVSARGDADTVTVRVADNGPGIPDQRKEAIFEQDPDQAHGIGLYLVERLLQFYDGSIAVTDNDPEGSVFTVTLPRTAPETMATDPEPVSTTE